MSTYTRACSISYKAFRDDFAAGTLQVVNWYDYSALRSRIQAVRAAGGEVIQYIEPPRWTPYPGDTGLVRSFFVPGTNYTVQAAQAAGWTFGGPNHALLPNIHYPGAYATDIRASPGPGGTAWMRHIIQWCCDRANDPNWELDGFFFDSTGDVNMSGAYSGWSSGEAADFNAGALVLLRMARLALGPDCIIIGNDFLSQSAGGMQVASQVSNGIVNEHHDENPNTSFLAGYYAICTHPKRRVIYISASASGAAASVGHPQITHIVVGQNSGEYIASSPPGTVAGIGNGAWPADALHVQGMKAINWGANPAGATGEPSGGGGGGLALPSIPTGLSIVEQSGSLALTWTANAGAEEVDTYQVYVNDAVHKLDVLGTAYTIPGLVNDTAYTVRISAHNATGYGDWTAAQTKTPTSAAPPPDTTPPLAPTAFSLGTPEGLNVPVSVTLPTDSDRATKTLYRSPSASGVPATSVAALTPGVSGDFPLTDTVPSSGTWYYQVIVRDAAGNATATTWKPVAVTTPSFGAAKFFTGSFAGANGAKPDPEFWRDPDVTRSGVTVGSVARLDGAGLLVIPCTPSAPPAFGRLGAELRVPLDLSDPAPRWLRVPIYCSSTPAAGSSSSRVLLAGTANLTDPNTSAEALRLKQVGTQLLVERRIAGVLSTIATLTAPVDVLYDLDLLLSPTTIALVVNGADANLGAGAGAPVAHGVSLPTAVLYPDAGNDQAGTQTAKFGAITFGRSTPSDPAGVTAVLSGSDVIYSCTPAPDEDVVTNYEYSIVGLGVQSSGSSPTQTAAAPAPSATPYVVQLVTENASPF